MQIEYIDLHFGLKTIGIIEAISCTNTDNSATNCDAGAMWHNNRTSSENPQNIGQVSYGGVQLRGPNPYPILGKAGLRKHTLF